MSTPKIRRADVRVVLPDGEHVVLVIPGDDPVVLEDDTVAALLAIGLAQRPASGSPKKERPRLEVDRRVQFVVDGIDLGVKRGLRTVRDGLAVAARVGLDEAKARADRRHRPADADAPPARPASGDVDIPELVMEVADFEHSFDEVFVRVERDEVRLVLTRAGRHVALMVSWRRWRRLHERLARERLAYWTAWSDDGTFDPQGFAAQVESSEPEGDRERARSVGHGR